MLPQKKTARLCLAVVFPIICGERSRRRNTAENRTQLFRQPPIREQALAKKNGNAVSERTRFFVAERNESNFGIRPVTKKRLKFSVVSVSNPAEGFVLHSHYDILYRPPSSCIILFPSAYSMPRFMEALTLSRTLA